jgi:glycosyltransferase involved in cell wall biosynthesis
VQEKVVFNIMLSRHLGGIQQVFLDYYEALTAQHFTVINVIHPHAKIRATLDERGWPYVCAANNWGIYDPIAIYKLARLTRHYRPNAIITHGTRAGVLVRKAVGLQTPVISVAHNYKYTRLFKADYIIAITDHIQQALIRDSYPKDRILQIPNMIALPKEIVAVKERTSDIPVIGTLGRLHHDKGFDILLRAVALLHQKDIPCRLLIGGDGEESAALHQLTRDLHLDDHVTFQGWIQDKAVFFKSCDIFCMPSRHEPFGVVLLEAFAHKVPTAATQSEGPSEIACHQQEAEMSPVDDVEGLAESLKKLMDDPLYARDLADRAYARLCKTYSMPVVGKRLSDVLHHISPHKMEP